jgi:predicted nucleic acid-binding Zn ribbon protein
MSENTLKFVAILAMIAVTVVLIRGLKTFFKGGDLDSKKKSNKLMQMRVMLQFCAIVVLMSLTYITGK